MLSNRQLDIPRIGTAKLPSDSTVSPIFCSGSSAATLALFVSSFSLTSFFAGTCCPFLRPLASAPLPVHGALHPWAAVNNLGCFFYSRSDVQNHDHELAEGESRRDIPCVPAVTRSPGRLNNAGLQMISRRSRPNHLLKSCSLQQIRKSFI